MAVDGCGSAKGCYRNPPGCSHDCDIIVTWRKAGNDIEFELGAISDGWVAVGFSEDKKMVSAVLLHSQGEVHIAVSEL